MLPAVIWYGRGAHYLDHVQEIEVPASGELAVTARLETAGRLKIAARAKDGRLLPATCSLRSADGESILLLLTCYTSAGGTTVNANALFGAPAKLVGDTANDVVSALRAGRYEIEIVHEGYRTHRAPVTITDGRTTTVDVTLTPE